MKILSSFIQPRYIPCSKTKVSIVCGIHPECSGKATHQLLIDDRDGGECSPKHFMYCGC